VANRDTVFAANAVFVNFRLDGQVRVLRTLNLQAQTTHSAALEDLSKIDANSEIIRKGVTRTSETVDHFWDVVQWVSPFLKGE